jgi:hypothetical protein
MEEIMNDKEHTPGPWKANGNGVHRGTSCVAIAYDPSVASGVTDVTVSNARLIAAAPDLLEACNAHWTFASHAENCGDCEEWGSGNCAEGSRLFTEAWRLTGPAIAKARGESS